MCGAPPGASDLTAARDAALEGASELVAQLTQVGLDQVAAARVVPLRERHGHAVYRLECGPRSFVLKWFPDPARAVEVPTYALLEAYGVPTPRVHARTAHAHLLEDLARSAAWRLATPADLARAGPGAAVAAWYRALHEAGRRAVTAPGGPPPHLRREADVLDAASVCDLGERLGLSEAPGWAQVVESIDALRQALRALPETLTYGDFHWSNLALARGAEQAGAEAGARALVFGHHLLGLGPAESDLRNVLGSLEEPARAAFRAAYGAVNERALRLDAPVATLYALHEAAQRPQLPRWAAALVREVRTGAFAAGLRRALAAL